MEHNYGSPFTALIASILSIVNAYLAVISWLANIQGILSLAASIIAITSGILAGRYYYYASNKAKQDSKHTKPKS